MAVYFVGLYILVELLKTVSMLTAVYFGRFYFPVYLMMIVYL